MQRHRFWYSLSNGDIKQVYFRHHIHSQQLAHSSSSVSWSLSMSSLLTIIKVVTCINMSLSSLRYHQQPNLQPVFGSWIWVGIWRGITKGKDQLCAVRSFYLYLHKPLRKFMILRPVLQELFQNYRMLLIVTTESQHPQTQVENTRVVEWSEQNSMSPLFNIIQKVLKHVLTHRKS